MSDVRNYSAISTPTVTINNVVMSIVPNSAAYSEGLGEDNVRAASNGGGSISVVVAKDAEKFLSMLKFQFENTFQNIEYIKSVKASFAFNVVSFFDSKTGFIRTMQQAILTTDYEVGLGSDTPISIEFKGAPVV